MDGTEDNNKVLFPPAMKSASAWKETKEREEFGSDSSRMFSEKLVGKCFRAKWNRRQQPTELSQLNRLVRVRATEINKIWMLSWVF